MRYAFLQSNNVQNSVVIGHATEIKRLVVTTIMPMPLIASRLSGISTQAEEANFAKVAGFRNPISPVFAAAPGLRYRWISQYLSIEQLTTVT